VEPPDPIKRDRGIRIARAIRAFVENPITILIQGLVLILIGVSEAARTFREDLAHGQLRVGHGLVVIGLFSILQALPHLIEGLEAGSRYLESKEKKVQTRNDADRSNHE
jgi:hypothetical protein